MILFNEEKKCWIIETESNAYVLGLTEAGDINHIYFGIKLPYVSDYLEAVDREMNPYFAADGVYREEYMASGGTKYTEPCLKAAFSDNVRTVTTKYEGYVIKDDLLTITLKDTFYPLVLKLNYKVIPDCDIVERWAEVINNGTDKITLESVLSGSTYLPTEKGYRLSYMAGKWGGEFQLEQMDLPKTKVVLESRRGFTSHQTNPWYALDKNGEAAEQSGEVYYGALAYSGNWKIVFETNVQNVIKISGGINDFDFSWCLKPNTSFETPKLIMGYSAEGFGKASRDLHRYQLNHVLPEGHRSNIRKVLYNSWEATTFNINEAEQIKLARSAAALGVELFVMDDGWFGKRNWDDSSLGDWYVNKEKFANGLTGLIQEVNNLGMEFGLWVEPEMVNPDSDLYRANPDWVYHFQNRERTLGRNQLVLNVARKDVQEFIFTFMDRLLQENNIKFIKWDLNRAFSEVGYPKAPAEEQREVIVRHARAVYDIVGKLRKKHPEVIFQSCASGGGRVDLGILQYFDQVWPSDNTDGFDRLKIQEGFSYIYCSKIMESWVTMETSGFNRRKLSLKYRFHCCMMGNLGIGEDITKWNEEEKEEARRYIELYKNIRPIVQHGEQYRLLSPREGYITSVMYSSKDRRDAVLFAFLHSNNFGNELPRVKLQGLKENSIYHLEEIEKKMSGKALMEIGIRVPLSGDFDSALIRIKEVEY